MQARSLQTPNIFVVPPEEDNSAPWCCFDAAQRTNGGDDDCRNEEHTQVPSYAPYSCRTISGFETVSFLPQKTGTNETRSIVDALGDAHDYSDHESEQEPAYTNLDDGDDGIDFEVETDHEPGYPHCSGPIQLQPHEVGNDSDVVEVVKVRRHGRLTEAPLEKDSGLSTNGNRLENLRSRATQALRSLRGTIHSSSSTKSREFTKPPHRPITPKLKPSFKFRKTKTCHTSQTQKPDEAAALAASPNAPNLSRRSSSRLSQLFSSTLRRPPSTASFTSLTSQAEQSAPFSQIFEPPTHPSTPTSIAPRPSITFDISSKRSFESARARRESTYRDADQISTPVRTSFQHPSEEDETTPSWRTSIAQREISSFTRPISAKPPPRSISPTPSLSRTHRRFSVLSLHKIFHKPNPNIISDSPPLLVTTAPSTSPAISVCPSFSSASGSESSGRTTPIFNSPQTPTSLDENRERQGIYPTASFSTFGSGSSLGTSLHNGTASSLYSTEGDSTTTLATRASIPGVVPHRTSISTIENINSKPRNSLSSIGTSAISKSSALFTSTADDLGSSWNTLNSSTTTTSDGPMVGSSLAANHMPGLDLELGLDLGLGINLVPSTSGGLLASNGMSKPNAYIDRYVPPLANSKLQGGSTILRSLSLKNLGSKLGLGGGERQQTDVSDLPGQVAEEADTSLEMRLDSLHFDNLSFDVDNFLKQ